MKAVTPPASRAARAAGLRWTDDAARGYRRRRQGRGFAYLHPNGRPLKAEAELARIRCLGIPPAWERVWICRDPRGHLQATGIDAAGRKQYRYHPDWANARSESKFDRLADFARLLPKLRRHFARGLERDRPDREFILSAVARLLDLAALRVGNPGESAGRRTFGATTLLQRHLELTENGLSLDFHAKGAKRVKIELQDQALHRVFEEIADLPGRRLFTWLDDAGAPHPIGSETFNAWLAGLTGQSGITAKTFRTWAGTVAAFAEAERALAEGAKITVRRLSEAAAARLHNTPAIARKSYIHPVVLFLASADAATPPFLRRLRRLRQALARTRPVRGLGAAEARCLRLLDWARHASLPA